MTNKVKPNLGQGVFIAQTNTLAGIEEKRYFIHQYWCNSGHQNQLLELGILFTDKDEAIAKTKSLLGIAERPPKQEEWDGEGLPPVSVECEFKENSPSGVSTFSDWSKCSILAYNEPNESSSELQIIIRDDRGDAAIIYSCDEPVFRKPETPEQKAERERLEAIDSMFTELNLDEERELNEDDRESIYWKSCEVAYDAGYRKQ